MILTLMVAIAVVGLVVPLVRRGDARTPRGDVVQVLKTQLADIDDQVVAGVVAPDEADGLRIEVKRRLLTEAREASAPARPLSEKGLLRMAVGVAAILALAATGLYAKLGRPDLASSASAGAPAQATGESHPAGGDVAGMISQLEAKLNRSPNDPEGWSMLGWSYFRTGRYADAAKAYSHATSLDTSNADHPSSEGEALVRASEGQVTPQAQEAFRQALAIDPTDPRARYFLALAEDQAGDHEGAMDNWIALLRSAPAGAPWEPQVRAFVEKAASDRGEDISSRLPPDAAAGAAIGDVSAPSAANTPGPDAAQVASAGQLSDVQRQSMIAGMVENLAAQLKANPRDLGGWVRLMRVHMVLGQPEQAARAYQDAHRTFAGLSAQQAQLKDAAAAMGVPGL